MKNENVSGKLVSAVIVYFTTEFKPVRKLFQLTKISLLFPFLCKLSETENAAKCKNVKKKAF